LFYRAKKFMDDCCGVESSSDVLMMLRLPRANW